MSYYVICVCFANSDVQSILCCVYVLRPLPVLLDCPFLIVSSIFSNVYVCSSLVEDKHIYERKIIVLYKLYNGWQANSSSLNLSKL